ncbi:MAG: HIT domain-containing protein [Kiritimatiellae bacterium]|nr:HIT domain-containing protein [Kiritimatiellia bacterium]
MDDCIFCKIASGAIPSAKVYESGRVVAFLDANPMSEGHFLVVPKTHWRDLAAVPAGAAAAADDAATIAEVWQVVAAGVAAAVEVFGGGANVLQCTGEEAGQTVPHLHVHVIPRPKGGETPPQFSSGAFRYASDEARAATAAKLDAAIAKRMQP